MWGIREWALYWVSTPMRRMPELRQLERGKSTMRNLPPNGMAGLARQSVSCFKREPRPPARMRASVSRVSRLTSRCGCSKRIFHIPILDCKENTDLYWLQLDNHNL